MTKIVRKRMSEKDKEEWNELYEYVRKNVMGYDENQSLSREMVLRLKGLLTNKFMANNNVDDTANYSYRIVLNTFKFCMADIQKGLKINEFKDERHKINYVMKIVESNLNTVYTRMKKAEESKERTQSMEMKTATHSGATYQRKTEQTSSKLLDDLW